MLMHQSIDVGQPHPAQRNRIELHAPHVDLTVRRLRPAALTTSVVNTRPNRIRASDRNHAGPGIDQKSHRGPIDAALRDVMPPGIGYQGHHRRPVIVSPSHPQPDGSPAQLQALSPVTMIDNHAIALNDDKPNALRASLSNCQRSERTIVQQQGCLTPMDANEFDIRSQGGSRRCATSSKHTEKCQTQLSPAPQYKTYPLPHDYPSLTRKSATAHSPQPPARRT